MIISPDEVCHGNDGRWVKATINSLLSLFWSRFCSRIASTHRQQRSQPFSWFERRWKRSRTEQTEYWLTCVARRDLWLRRAALWDATAPKESVTTHRTCNTGEHFWTRRKQQSFSNSSWQQVLTPSAASTLANLELLSSIYSRLVEWNMQIRISIICAFNCAWLSFNCWFIIIDCQLKCQFW